MKQQRRLLGLLMAGALGMVATGHAAVDSPASSPQPDEGSRIVLGTVTKTGSAMSSISTEEGTVRHYSTKQLKQTEKIPDVRVGDQLAIVLNNHNLITHIDQAAHDRRPLHRTVMGQLVTACVGWKGAADQGIVEKSCGDPETRRSVTLKHEDGTLHTYMMKMAASMKVLPIEPHAHVAMEIDEANDHVMDFTVAAK
ncbi:MAG: hypothetical protein AB1515_02595 [Nitrospirota bacterium]